MMAGWKNKLNKLKKDDRGSALVMVIITIAFIGTLVAMMVYLVYYNYLMKYADRAAKNNFYTAEAALDEIKAGIQQDVSDAMIKSYYTVISEHTADTAQNQQAYFENEYRDNLESILGISSMSMGAAGLQEQVSYYEPSLLSSYWKETPQLSVTGTYGATVETVAQSSWTDLGTDTGLASFKEDGPVVVFESGNVLRIANVRISYTDEDGYVSIIETDIAIETPEINFANVLSLPELENYSLVSAGGIYNGYTRSTVTHLPELTAGTVTSSIVTGHVYGGEDGIFVNGVGQISFEKKADDATTSFTVTSNKISALNGRSQTSSSRPATTAGIKISEDYEVYAEDLYVESATMEVDAANSFIRDDLTLDGTYPKIVLEGNYYGYGTEYGTAENNSAILINGAHSTIDFSGLDSLSLAGHAYVGSVHYNAEDDELTDDYIADWDAYNAEKEDDEDEDSSDAADTDTSGVSVSNNSDILMGQSVAVKSDQLMYMVPVECMGYDGDTQILAKNPMTYDEYIKFATTYEPEYNDDGSVVTEDGEVVYSDELTYTAVRLDVVMDKAGGSLNSYGASYTPVFRRVNGSILVYFYMSFTSDEKANEFFRDYYNADQTAFNRYFNTYVDSYSINSDVLSNLSIAGNMLYKRGSRIYLMEDTFDEDLENYEALESNREQYLSYFQSLSKYLMKTKDDLSASQLKNDVFTNIAVDDEEFAEHVSAGTYKTFKNTDGDVVAIVVNNSSIGAFEINEGEYPNLHLVIATGDVEVNVSEFDGLIFSGANIYIGQSNTRIDYDAAEVQKAMTAKSDDGNYAFEVIQNGIAYANSLGTTDADLLDAIEDQKERDVVRAEDLVKFVNWNKE